MTTSTSARSFGFVAILFVTLGWANFEQVLLQAGAGIRAQLTGTVAGLVLLAVTSRRCKLWWHPRSGEALDSRSPTGRLVGSAVSGTVLFSIGCVLGYSMRMGLFVASVLCAGVLMFIPWSRSRFCREHFFVAQLLLLTGGVLVLLIATRQDHPVVLLVHSFNLWSLATGIALVTLFQRERPVQTESQRMALARSGDDISA